ncbi:succinylglutamate desuccinylase/aspartoacylase domain-containing protein [Sneathiella limimaris]|uniref:succinylglutamate desuccinylase/aspartoacylase domain-containing protein n=1 Tax=Sneathiella limimaris TaxID=1964213 RepID=UPI0019D0399C|nr:succinylglutamate desuccinylase/aspartoacylase family protein [Sneathiella limimaris]
MIETETPEFNIELQAPDISAYKEGNTGVDYVTTLDSGVDGPHVMISAVVHGNELCGAIAVDHLFKQNVKPLKGKLTLAFMNVAAFHSFNPEDPTKSRFVDEDFNRVWTPEILDGPRDSVELKRAREVRPIVETVDYLFDIHSMLISPDPLMMAGPVAKGRDYAKKIGLPKYVITDSGHANGTRMRDYVDFINPASDKNALLIECGTHWAKETADLAIKSVYRLLDVFDMIPKDLVEKFGPTADDLPEQVFVEVSGPYTVETDAFEYAEDYEGMEVIHSKGTVIGYDGDKPVTTPYDKAVLVMPSLNIKKGHSAVRWGRIIED